MNTTLKASLSLLTLLALSAHAQTASPAATLAQAPAADAPYAEGVLMVLKSCGCVDGYTSQSTQHAAGVWVGRPIAENVSVEGLLATGLGSYNIKITGPTAVGPTTGRLNLAYGVFLRGTVPLDRKLDFLARFGRIEGYSTVSRTSGAEKIGGSDWAWGMGLNYRLDETSYLTSSWLRMYNKDGVRVNGFMLGVGRKF